MKNYINTYATSGAVQTALDNGELLKPYVAYISGEDAVDWNSKINYRTIPLTFEILSDGYVDFNTNMQYSTNRVIEYSLNNNEWISITGSNTPEHIIVSTGDKIRFRGNNDSYTINNNGVYSYFSTTCNFRLFGNIMSLINATNYSSLIILPDSTYPGGFTFANLFINCTGLTDASNLVLPATTLANYCYQDMFKGCTSLTMAPALPATTLALWCYSGMFSGCSNLNYIKCLAMDISAANCTRNWLNGVSATGTFVTPSTTSWTTGDTGIPNGWNRVNSD